MARPLHGFTLVEVLVASAISVVILSALVGSLIHTSRGVTREDLTMTRARVLQTIVSRLSQDFSHLSTQPLSPLDSTPATDEALHSMGFGDDLLTFANWRSQGSNLIDIWKRGEHRPRVSAEFPFSEKWSVFQDNVSHRWRAEPAPPPISYYTRGKPHFVLPCLPLHSATMVASPDERLLFLGLRCVCSVDRHTKIVLWRFEAPRADGGRTRGIVLRWDSALGALEDLSRDARCSVAAGLYQHWVVCMGAGMSGGPGMLMLRIATEFLPATGLPFPDPGLKMQRVFTAGL